MRAGLRTLADVRLAKVLTWLARTLPEHLQLHLPVPQLSYQDLLELVLNHLLDVLLLL